MAETSEAVPPPPSAPRAAPDENSKTGSEQARFECKICTETAVGPVVTPCGHLYCWTCIYKWFEQKQPYATCPVCNGKLEIDKMIPIFTGDEGAHPSSNVPRRPQAHREQAQPPPPNAGRGFNNGGGTFFFGFGPFMNGFAFNFGNGQAQGNARYAFLLPIIFFFLPTILQLFSRSMTMNRVVPNPNPTRGQYANRNRDPHYHAMQDDYEDESFSYDEGIGLLVIFFILLLPVLIKKILRQTKSRSTTPLYVSCTLVVQTLCNPNSLYLVYTCRFKLPVVSLIPVSYTHLRAHETDSYLVCRLLLEKKKAHYLV
eukprot:TRINITY_DN3209_c0_g1_i7.p1 TRINITY_DN3209_c0_g1~~TRINITY_DN3209_c0_g1_i7.p1  ORF type:complete len:314 (-),score=22.55 TRINITY_DN3209_c0_g1_i7:34-975(-)